MKGRKRKNIIFRCTEEEFLNIKEKAKKYPSISSLILDSVRDFQVEGGRNKISLLIETSIKINKNKNDLSKIGNNINQIAHYLNIAKAENRFSLEEMKDIEIMLEKYYDILCEIDKEQRNILEKIWKY